MPGVGAYGKLPALGDFFRIAPPAGFVEPWDSWLQMAMTAGIARLGPRWQDCFLTAPIWRFSLSAGLAGRLPVWGVLMPSVDRVGRLFPLTLVAPIPSGAEAVKWHFTAAPAFERLEEVALDALSDAMTRETLASRLAGCPLPDPPAPGCVSRAGQGVHLREPAGGAALAGLAAHLAGTGRARPSIWSQSGEAGDDILLEDGLPPAERAHLLFAPDRAEAAGALPRRPA